MHEKTFIFQTPNPGSSTYYPYLQYIVMVHLNMNEFPNKEYLIFKPLCTVACSDTSGGSRIPPVDGDTNAFVF